MHSYSELSENSQEVFKNNIKSLNGYIVILIVHLNDGIKSYNPFFLNKYNYKALSDYQKLIDALEENDDVQKVYHNLDVKPEQEHFFN